MIRQQGIRGEHRRPPDLMRSLVDRTDRRQQPRNPDHPVHQCFPQSRIAGFQPLAGRGADLPSHGIRRLPHPGRARHIRAQHPLQEFVLPPASERVREIHIRRRDRLHHHRLDTPERLPRNAEDIHPVRIRQPRQHVTGQHRIEVGDDPIQEFRGAVHTP